MSVNSRELVIFIENDGGLYRQQGLPIIKNLTAKKASGKYQHPFAVKLYGYLATNGAKKYAKEFGGTWNQMFSVADRKQAAEELARGFEAEYNSGAYSEYIPAKYKKANPALGVPIGKFLPARLNANGTVTFKVSRKTAKKHIAPKKRAKKRATKKRNGRMVYAVWAKKRGEGERQIYLGVNKDDADYKAAAWKADGYKITRASEYQAGA